MNIENIILLTVLVILSTALLYYFYERYTVGDSAPLTAFPVYSPVAAALLLSDGTTSRHITAMLLYSVQQGYVSAVKKHSEYEFRINTDKIPEDEHEKFFLHWLFYEVGSEGSFRPEDVWNATLEEEERGKFLETLEEWESLTKADLRKYGFTRSVDKVRKLLVSASLLLIVLGASAIFMQIFITFTAWVGAFLLMLLSFQKDWYTSNGKEETNRLVFYRNSLQKNVPGDQEAEQMTKDYIYAIVFGLKEDFEKKYPIRDASELRVQQENFPLYMAGTGSAALVLSSVESVDEIEAAFQVMIEPGAHSMDNISNHDTVNAE